VRQWAITDDRESCVCEQKPCSGLHADQRAIHHTTRTRYEAGSSIDVWNV